MAGDDAFEAGVRRLRAALTVVQKDLDRTRGGPTLHVHVPSPTPPDGPADLPPADLAPADREPDDEPAAYLAAEDDLYQGSSSGLQAPTRLAALVTVAEGVQDYLAEFTHEVWPLCARHRLGAVVRPAGASPEWSTTTHGWGERTVGSPAWWCSGDGGHDITLVGQLAPTDTAP